MGALSGQYFDFDNLASVELAQRVQTASEEYRMRLQGRASALRAALLKGETRDPRVVAFVKTLEQMVRNKN